MNMQENMNMNMNNNGMVRAPPASFQSPMFQNNTGFGQYMNNNMNYGQQQMDNNLDAPSAIVSFAPGRARPGASSQIYGNTICSPLNDKDTVSTSEQTQSQLPATTVIATPSNDTITSNNNMNQVQNNFSDNQQFGLYLFCTVYKYNYFFFLFRISCKQ